MADFNLDDLLNDILDDSKPLPEATPALKPEPDVNTIIDATLQQQGLEELLSGEPQGTLDAATGIIQQAEEKLEEEVKTVLTPEAPAGKGDYSLPDVPIPTFTTEEIASTLDLRNFATMTTLNTKRWHAKVKDRKASKDIALANNADEGAFETRKRLLAGADEKLKAIHKAIDTARAKYYALTLPWTTTGIEDTGRRSGARIMPNTQFFEFVTEMGKCKDAMTAALDEFVPAYPALIQQAQKNLGRRFDPTEYPPAESIRSHFDISFDFLPIPEGHDFKGLPQAQCQALADALQKKTKVMVENAMQDLWVRAHEAIGRMAERLSHPDKMFHASLVENVRMCASQLQHLNVTNDPDIRALQQHVEKYLCPHEVEDLRKKPALRTEVAGRAMSAIEMMRQIAAREVK